MTRLHMVRPQRIRSAGFSLIELMISMVIGMVVVGAVFAAYLGMGTSSRANRALAQMTEDTSLAMNVLRSHISMADFSEPTGVNPDGTFVKAYTGAAVKGCNSRFTDPAVDIDTLACSGAGADAIAVIYQADDRNVINSGGGQPLDCLGNTFAQTGAIWLSYSRFFVNDGQLYCLGPGNDTPAALVENIEDMKVWYGVATAGQAHQVAYYARAGNAGEMNASDFSRVVSVRVCLVVKSENEVLDSPSDYVDCDGASETPPDKRLYRAFTSTIVLQNRMGTN